MSTSPEIVPFSETISQTAQEGLGFGGQAIAKSEMPGIGHSGETRQPGQEGLRLGQDVRLSTTPEVGKGVETNRLASFYRILSNFSSIPRRVIKSQVVSGSTFEMRSDGNVTGRKKLKSASGENSVEIELFQASKDSKWFDAIEKKNCKLLLQLFRSDRRLWVQTGLKGRSVLHVAVMQGCSELVGELHNYMDDLVPYGNNWQTPFQFLWENARDGRLKNASAQDIWLVMEGPYISDSRKYEWWEKREPFTKRSRDDYLESHVVCRMAVDSEDSEMKNLRDAIRSIADEKDFRMDENDVDFNFENVERKELYVHMACSMLRNGHNHQKWDQIVEFIIAVLTDLLEKDLLQKLFNQKDAQGRTILQVLLPYEGHRVEEDDCGPFSIFFRSMLKILPEECVRTPDKAGRTVLHWAVAHEIGWAVKELLNSGKARPAFTFHTAYILNISAFHLILLYDNDLPNSYHPHLRDELFKNVCDFPLVDSSIFAFRHGTNAAAPLFRAIRMGRNKFVEQVMETTEYRDSYLPQENELLAWAACSGNVEILQHFLRKDDVDKLNSLGELFEAPPLHLAVAMTTILRDWADSRFFDDWVHCNDFISINLLEKKLLKKDLEEDKTKHTNGNQYSAKQVCANLLLQAGADILATDKYGHMADPGAMPRLADLGAVGRLADPEAVGRLADLEAMGRLADSGATTPNEARIWWYDLVAKETLNIKNDLNAAGTGTAVVAALVATASFVGPLTPPLNYVTMSSGTTTVDVEVQVTELLIKVFLVSNSLSFYLAITSIMLAIMPSLPIPKEGLVSGPCDDLKRNRRTIAIAIGILLTSIISVLISFAASSFVVITLQHRRLMACSMSIGGSICFVGIFFFSLRLLRLIFPRNTFINKLYRRIGKL